MSDKTKQRRTFEIKMVVTVSTEKTIDAMLDMKNEILSGKAQREMVWEEGCDKVTMTFKELTND